jgi:hypothetical protein
MGQHKEEASRLDSLNQIAEEIAIQAGLLTKCSIHEEVYDSYEGEYEDAYRLANLLITNSSDLVAPFKGDRKKLTDLIQNIRNNYGDSCLVCEKYMDD